MAYTPHTLSGNVVSNANGVALLTYTTPDTKAEVLAVDYFSVDRSNVSHKVLHYRDVILCQCSDGLQVLMVISQGSLQVTVEAKLVEA